MRKVTLYFEDTTALADFVITQKITNAEVNNASLSLTAPLSDAQIAIACSLYNAELKLTPSWY